MSVDDEMEHIFWQLNMCIEISTEAQQEAKAKVYSLLISKLPEKRKTDGYSRTGGVGPINYAYNQAIDDVKAVLAELFGVGDE